MEKEINEVEKMRNNKGKKEDTENEPGSILKIILSK